MKYNQPYGVSDPNAVYVNGNPSTGTRGSIPPAASIEYPQREIVNMITAAGLITPSNAELRQLAFAIQSGGVNYSDDNGTPNQLSVNLNPPPPMLRRGLHVYTVIKHPNYAGDASTLVILNATPPHNVPKPILHMDGSVILANEFKAGMLALFCYDGDSWQWVSAPVQPLIKGTLQEDVILHVKPTGNDANDGLTLATAFRTIRRAINYVTSVNLNSHSITIRVQAGTYQENVTFYPLSGNGSVHLIATKSNGVTEETNPELTVIAPLNGICIHWGSLFAVSGWYVRGFKLQSQNNSPPPPTGTGYEGNGIFGGWGAVSFANMSFGPCFNAHVLVTGGCRITIGDGLWRITGGAKYHIVLGGHCELNNFSPAMEITGTPNFSEYFIKADALALASARWSSINGYALGGEAPGAPVFATGKRYWSGQNSIINTGFGGTGPLYLPGNQPGVTSNGGLYL